MEVIGVIIAGIVIGVLAQSCMPGRQNISALITVVLGVFGVLIGWYLAAALGVESTSGIDWIRWIISIIVAAALIAGYIALTGRRHITHV